MAVSLPSSLTGDNDLEGSGPGLLESSEVSESPASEEALESELGVGSDLGMDAEMVEICDGGGVGLE